MTGYLFGSIELSECIFATSAGAQGTRPEGGFLREDTREALKYATGAMEQMVVVQGVAGLLYAQKECGFTINTNALNTYLDDQGLLTPEGMAQIDSDLMLMKDLLKQEVTPEQCAMRRATAEKMGVLTQASGSAGTEQSESFGEGRELRGRCLLQVKGTSFIDGECSITLSEGGDFQVMSVRNGAPEYFAVVSMAEGGAALGVWNEDRGANHAHTPLGTLRREGACWLNDEAKVCAWK